MDLNDLQEAVARWQSENFPDCCDWELALGVCEEAGELADCVLKAHRGIRGNEYTEERMRDAVGDIIVYLFGLCDKRGWLLTDVVSETAGRVLSRKWR